MPVTIQRGHPRYPGAIYGDRPYVRPRDLPIVGWWKADAQAYKDLGSTLCVNNDTVEQWNDQSGYGWNFTQTTSGNRPAFKTNVLNGNLPVIRFDGSSSKMIVNANSFTPGSVMSFFFVVIPSSTSPVGIFDSAPGQQQVFRNYSAGKWEWWNTAPQFNLSLANTNPVLIELVTKQYATTNLRIVDYYRNGVLISSNGSGLGGGQMGWNTPGIGSINGGGAGLWYQGDMAEIILAMGVPSPYHRVGIETYLNRKYALY